jgi:hypothetical protein
MMTKNGVSTTTIPGQFQSERFYSCFQKCWMVQWDYRTPKGKLHSGVARSLEAAKKQAARHGYREAE